MNDISVRIPLQTLELPQQLPFAIEQQQPPVVEEIVESFACTCGEESTHGVHGLQGGEIYSKHYCNKCYYQVRNKRAKDE